jgi:hypothetical protein
VEIPLSAKSFSAFFCCSWAVTGIFTDLDLAGAGDLVREAAGELLARLAAGDLALSLLELAISGRAVGEDALAPRVCLVFIL